MRRQLPSRLLKDFGIRFEESDLLRSLDTCSVWAFMLKFLLFRNAQIVGESDRLWPVLPQPAVGRVAHDHQGPSSSIDGTETLDAAKRAQCGILHDVFG